MTSSDQKTDPPPAPQAGDGAVKSPVEARQGIKTYRIRWVLAVSLTLAIVAMGATWLVVGAGAPA